jgi:hypothetical protein
MDKKELGIVILEDELLSILDMVEGWSIQPSPGFGILSRFGEPVISFPTSEVSDMGLLRQALREEFLT